MTNLMVRIVTLATFLIAVNAPASFTPAFGAGGAEEVVVVVVVAGGWWWRLLTRGTSAPLVWNCRRARRATRSRRPKSQPVPFRRPRLC